jgi:hypothetical protein
VEHYLHSPKGLRLYSLVLKHKTTLYLTLNGRKIKNCKNWLFFTRLKILYVHWNEVHDVRGEMQVLGFNTISPCDLDPRKNGILVPLRAVAADPIRPLLVPENL